MGKPAATDRRRLPSLSHSFTLDFLACFQYGTEAEAFRESLGHRMEAFQLELAEEKTRHLEFGRYARTNAYRRGKNPRTSSSWG